MFDIFRRTNSPEELHKKRKDQEFMEALKKISFSVSESGCLTVHGLSEYGARELLKSGEEPRFGEKVMTSEGELVSWQEWRSRNG